MDILFLKKDQKQFTRTRDDSFFILRIFPLCQNLVAYITHNATRPPAVQLEILVCYACNS